jgi:hypothetical protein
MVGNPYLIALRQSGPSSVRNRRHAPNRRSNFSQPNFAGMLKNPANTLA